MIINKKILGACEIASTDKIRPAMNGIKFEKDRAVATDGYSLIVVPLPQEDPTRLPGILGQNPIDIDECVLPAQDIKKIASEIKQNKRLPALQNAWSIQDKDAVVRFVTTDLDRNVLLDIKKVDGAYPKYQKILDEGVAKPKKGKIAFNAKYMIRLLDAMVRSGATMDGTVQIEIAERNDPIMLKAKDNNQKEIIGLLMPVRLSESDL